MKSCTLLLLLLLFFTKVTPAPLVLDATWSDAMTNAFALTSRSNAVSGNLVCSKSIFDLMVRQRIPTTPSLLRALNDTELLRVAMIASVAGVSTWKRDVATNTLFQLTDQGKLVQPYTPNAVESDVMLCVVCVLLIVIAIFHLAPSPITA
jgi:hypothetical protein